MALHPHRPLTGGRSRRWLWFACATATAGWLSWAALAPVPTVVAVPAQPAPAPVDMSPVAAVAADEIIDVGRTGRTALAERSAPSAVPVLPAVTGRPVETGPPMLPPGMPMMSGVAPNADGLAVFGVTDGSVMDRLGLRNGDVLMSVNGQLLGVQTNVSKVLAPLMIGRTAQAYVLRDGQTVLTTLALRPDPENDAKSAKALADILKEEGIVVPANAGEPSGAQR